MIWPVYSPPFARRATHDSFGSPCLTGILHAPVVSIVIWSQFMGDRKYLTAEEVAERCILAPLLDAEGEEGKNHRSTN